MRPPVDPKPSPVSRRRLFAGAGTAGALAAAATVLPLSGTPEPVAQAEPKAAPEAGGGYQLTAHARRHRQLVEPARTGCDKLSNSHPGGPGLPQGSP